MDNFFTKAFENMSDRDRESFYKTVFLNDRSEYAARKRVEYYKRVLHHMGKNVRIGAGVKIENPELISIGDNVQICDGATLIARPETEIVIGNKLSDRLGIDNIHVENDVYIGTGTTLFGHLGLEIGDHVLMAQNITLTPYSHKFDDPDVNIIKQGGHSKKVVIGRDSYIGMGVCIMYSGDIGEGSVIAAGAVVVKPIPPYSVAVGCPAKVIKKREKTL